MSWDKAKMFLIAFGTALTAWMGILAIPVYLLVLLGIADYITGVIAAPYRGQNRNSVAGLRGIIKKLCMLLLVGLGAIVDWLLVYASQNLGIILPFEFVVASLTAVWLICNEIISILENIGDSGVALPPFLNKLVQWVKKTCEEKGDQM